MQPPSVPPIQHEVRETALERQTRIRPSATPRVISDGDLNRCAICLDKVWRLQRGLEASAWPHIPCAVLGPSCARSCGQTVGWHYGRCCN
eukprot:4047279-Pyramimonas_sp.AAC.1